MRRGFRKEKLSEYKPEEYVYKDKEGREDEEDKKTRRELIPDFLPLYVLGLFLEKFNALIEDVLEETAYLFEEVLYLF